MRQEVKKVRKGIRKHLLEGDWLICIDAERGCFDAVFLSRDNHLVVYPMTDVKERVSNELLPYVETAGNMLYFEALDGRFEGLLPNYEKYLQSERANQLRKQMYKVIFVNKCHEFVNNLMCLEFGVCNQDKQECGGEPRRIKALRTTSWSL